MMYEDNNKSKTSVENSSPLYQTYTCVYICESLNQRTVIACADKCHFVYKSSSMMFCRYLNTGDTLMLTVLCLKRLDGDIALQPCYQIVACSAACINIPDTPHAHPHLIVSSMSVSFTIDMLFVNYL